MAMWLRGQGKALLVYLAVFAAAAGPRMLNLISPDSLFLVALCLMIVAPIWFVFGLVFMLIYIPT